MKAIPLTLRWLKIKSLKHAIVGAAISLIFVLFQLSHADELPVDSRIETQLQQVFGERVYEIRKYNEDLYEIRVDNRLFLATPDGRYIFAGTVFDTHLMQDISVLQNNRHRQEYLGQLQQNQFIQYPSKAEKYVVTVFTDIACPYCRAMHQDMKAFNELGISINYVMLPRGGKGSSNYEKTLWALCSENAASAVNHAMENKSVAKTECEDRELLQEHQLFARALNINHTPSIILPTGELHLGRMNPEQMISLLAKVNVEESF